MELPNTHRIPVGWLLEHASAPLRYRTLRDLAPDGFVSAEELEEARIAAERDPAVVERVKKQDRKDGLWGGNILAEQADEANGIKDVGTVPTYRHLVELGVSSDHRVLHNARRPMFRILSRDPDPGLQFEFKEKVVADPGALDWVRHILREGVTAALCHGGFDEDPRVRGSAQRIIDQVSKFLRSDMAEDPFSKQGNRIILHPDARPPTPQTIAILAFMPSVQRERAGFVGRLAKFLNQEDPGRKFGILAGETVFESRDELLGDPLRVDSAGVAKDTPFALYWIEMMARLNLLEEAPSARQTLASLLEGCDADGVWKPSNLRNIPKSSGSGVDFYYPLELATDSADQRRIDATFRLGLIAKLAGWEIQYA